jgi:diadenosine tetraphosphate (Ap4A) HIT family hydrolase
MAITFLTQDESQIRYYEKRITEMPIKVLAGHGVLTKDRDLIKLSVQKLSFEQKAELKRICDDKLQQYIASRGLAIWDYRLLDSDPVPDSLRFRVLKDSKGRCALCGATKSESPLDVDHIIPRSKGGKTVYENLQVLCAKCNRSKGNKDKTDFRTEIARDHKEGCIFCDEPMNSSRIVENALAFARTDAYPVTEGHTLIVPKRHVADYFDLTEFERGAINDLLRVCQKQLLKTDPSIEGFNIGANCGETAGQTIFHCHMHLIPRRAGDTPNPRGGVRCVIPTKTIY